MSSETTSVRKTKSPGLTAQAIKMIAIISMLLDHIGYAIVIRFPAAYDPSSSVFVVYMLLRCVGRLAFPLYCYMLVEGIMHTRSPLKYALRMLIFAFISEIPFDLAFYGQTFWWNHQNVFFTLFLGVLMLWGFEVIRKGVVDHLPGLLLRISVLIIPPVYSAWRLKLYRGGLTGNYEPATVPLYIATALAVLVAVYVLLTYVYKKYSERTALVLCADILITCVASVLADLAKVDYVSAGILTIAAMYMFRNNDERRIVSGCVILTLLSSPIELFVIIDVPLISKYNHERGRGMKYLFYAFYPAHLLILYLIAKLLGLWVAPDVI